MRYWLAFLIACSSIPLAPRSVSASDGVPAADAKVYVIPVRDAIMPPMAYLVRRGVKEAMEAKADSIILDMETDGGRVDVTEDIINIIGQFKGKTYTYVNRKAFSAGAFISVATQEIYMAPQSVIGAAAPILMAPGGTGTEAMPDTMEAKITSGIAALVRATAEKNGHNPEVVDAMIDKTKELIIDGEVINEKGQILTLTNVEAEKEYGEPAKPLLSAGTVESLDELITKLGYQPANVHRVEPLGAERLASWINKISPLLLIIGIAGIYLEFKTPGFGLPGIIGITAFAFYFLGSYIAGLAGMEWMVVFILGLALVFLEIFVFPGTLFLGLTGALLMLVTIVMAMVDMYPGMPSIPSFSQLTKPAVDLLITFGGSLVVILLLSRWLPKTSIWSNLVSQSASGTASVAQQEEVQTGRVGQVGETVSALRPGGKAQFGDQIIDVVSQGEMIPMGRKVKIIRHSAYEAVVEETGA